MVNQLQCIRNWPFQNCRSEFINKCSQTESYLNLNEQVDENLLSSVNSKYIDTDEYNSLDINKSTSFELLHINIASLDRHIDDLRFLISKLSHKPVIIGISEHKIQSGSVPYNNITLSGYNEFIFTPTNSSHGGAVFILRRTPHFLKEIIST